MEKEYVKLIEALKSIKSLESIHNLLDWDQETVMPKEGIHARAKQSAELSYIIHQKKTSKNYENLISKCINPKTKNIKLKSLDYRHQVNLKLILEDFSKAKKLPNKFVKNLAELKSLSSQAWSKAKSEDRFDDFAPYLEKIVTAMRKEADYLSYDDHPYDALLDLYEPKMTVKEIDKLFKDLKKGLLDITQTLFKIKSGNYSILNQELHEDVQLKFCRSLLPTLGLSESIARLDTSSHPFCNTIANGDIRLTTHIKPIDPFAAISSTMHEAGHGIYEAGLVQEDFGTPIGEACSLGVHESQSRLFETFIGQSKPFIHYLAKALKGKLSNLNEKDLYLALNKVEPSFIRIESDEVTYCLHIMIRYELEKQLIEGSLKVKDLREAWNESMVKYLGIRPPTDREGCLQDIHWSAGLFGYFPTYALGNIYAAQIHERLQTSFKDFDLMVGQGDFSKINSWLNHHIHRFGRERTPKELIETATKKSLSADAYLNYLREKYL